MTNFDPVPVCDATDVVLPELVIGPVKSAFVAFAVVIAPVTNAVVAICSVLIPAVAVGANGVPVKVGESKGAFRPNAVWAAVETGLFASLVLSTSERPTIVFVIPPTVPVKVGEAKGAFKSNVDCKPSVLAIDKTPSAIAVAFPTLVTGPVKFALVPFAVVIAPVTNSVVATCVVLVPAVAVGAAGVPVNVGEARGDFKSNAV
jgi:hypothetical protein